ncbi:MAG: hypothetical protein JKX85_06210 [Phycisphaeraceae bacterium]|nr:hypothetical protein [Phycisphaeraceae bacterium]
MQTISTAGNIARDLGVEYHQVDHVIKKLQIKPTGRVGIIRIFSPQDVERIAREFQARQTTPHPTSPQAG